MEKGNKQLLEKLNRDLLLKLENISENDMINKINAKNGSPTLAISQNEKVQYIHSSYNPEREGMSISESLEINDGTPIIFLGIGLGYHVRHIINKVKPQYFYFIELIPEVLKLSLETLQLNDVSYKNLTNMFLPTSNNEIQEVIVNIIGKSAVPPTLVILPSYQTIFKKNVNQFLTIYQDLITAKYDQVASDYNFQGLWGLNSLNNFLTILETPNLFIDVDIDQFKGKPAIIAGAGPSLSKEIANLKKIQEENSAFIFAVGSALNALIEYDIRPHATIVYDPKKENVRVFEKIKQRNIKDIPLLFASTIGFESIKDYPGQKIHFLLNQDFLNPFLLFSDKNSYSKIISDGPTVTVVALDLLKQLECDPIILIGQNLSFENNIRYAKGIQYKPGSSGGIVAPTKSYFVKSVTGEELKSSKEFLLAKNSIESFLEQHQELNVINCTQNGAVIKYTNFYPLSTVMLAFKQVNAAYEILLDRKSGYDRNAALNKANVLYEESESFPKSLNLIQDTLNEIENFREQKNVRKLNESFVELDRVVHRVTDSNYYSTLIGPMTRIYYQKAAKEIQFINQNKSSIDKAKEIFKQFNFLLHHWSVTHEVVYPYICKFKSI